MCRCDHVMSVSTKSSGSDVPGDTGIGSQKRHSSIEMSTFDFTPYGIPASSNSDVCLDDYSLPSINTVTTSLEYGFGDSAKLKTSDPECNKDVHMTHGFFFGAVSTELLSKQTDSDNEKKYNKTNSNFADEDDEEDYLEESIMSSVYSNSDVERWIRASQRSFKPSPELSKREVLSKRIKDVGHIGQNLGIGHLTGVWKEDAMLIPKAVTVETKYLYISEESPLQHDLSWIRPENASSFSTLVYNIEALLPDTELWISISSVRHTVFRIYHTEHKLFVGKKRLDRQNHDLKIWLRVCCQGEIRFSDGAKHWTQSPWCKEIEMVFLGYGSKPVVIEQTAL